MRTRRAAALLGACAVAVAASPSALGAGGGAHTVVLKHIAFTPSTVHIRTGQSVTWSWQDVVVTHNIHSMGSPRFAGATGRMKGTYTVRFAKAGTYRYECTLHPGMTGKVVVSGA